MDQIVEFHDSRISGVEIQGDRLRIHFSHAYVYMSGSGWSQEATLTVRGGALIEEPSSYPATVSEGELRTPSMWYYDLLEVPFSSQGKCELKLLLISGENLSVTGSDPEMVLHGEKEFIESVEMP